MLTLKQLARVVSRIAYPVTTVRIPRPGRRNPKNRSHAYAEALEPRLLMSALPSPFREADVGGPPLAGASDYNTTTGQFTVTGGNNGWSSDQFHYVFQPMVGDGQIVAKVDSIGNTGTWANAGVMFRQNLSAAASHADMILTHGQGARFLWRNWGDWNTSSAASTAAAPGWVKAVKTGSTVDGYTSSDGANWTLVSSATINLQGAYYVGLAVNSANGSALNTSTFSNVTVTGEAPDALPSEWSAADVGSPDLDGESYYQDGTFTFTVHGSGSDIWGTSDQFHFAYQPFYGDGSITARVLGQQNTGGWSKAGVMIRDGLGAGARNMATLMSPNDLAEYQVRNTADAATWGMVAGAEMPGWVRLTRVGNAVSGYISPDGVNWTLMTRDDLPAATLGGPVYVGLALTAVEQNGLNTATFDNVTVIQQGLPGISISGPTNATQNSPYTVTTSTSTPNIATWTIDWGDGSVDTFNSDPNQATHTYKNTGTYTIQATGAGDTTYNASPVSVTVGADLSAPTIAVTSPSNGATLATATPVISGTAGTGVGDGTQVTIQIFAGSTGAGTPIRTLSTSRDSVSGAFSVIVPAAVLGNGSYSVRALQQDTGGNIGGSSVVAFTVSVAGARFVSSPQTTFLIRPGEAAQNKAVWGHGNILTPGPNGTIQEYTPQGQLVRTLGANASHPTLLFFDANGNLFYSPDSSSADLYSFAANADHRGRFLGSVFHAEAAAGDAIGNILVFNADISFRDAVHRFSSDGRLIDRIEPGPMQSGAFAETAFSPALDLGPDQHMIWYLSNQYSEADGKWHPILCSMDINQKGLGADLQRADLYELMAAFSLPLDMPVNPNFRSLRVLRDGTFLIQIDNQYLHVQLNANGSGAVRRAYSVTGANLMGTPALDVDGRSFWVSGSLNAQPMMFRLDIQQGTLLNSFATANFGNPTAVFQGGAPGKVVPVGQPYQYTASVEGLTGEVRYSLIREDHGATMDSVRGEMLWSPTQVGQYTFTVVATDAENHHLVQVFTVDVQPLTANAHAPVIEEQGASLTSARVRELYVNRVTASDADGDQLRFSIVSGPSGMTIDAAKGVISWRPKETHLNSNGSVAATVRVDDGHGKQDEWTFSIPVLPPFAPFGEPTFTIVPDATDASKFHLQASVDNSQSVPLTYHWSISGGSKDWDGDRLFSSNHSATSGATTLTIERAVGSPFTITLQVTDGNSYAVVDDFLAIEQVPTQLAIGGAGKIHVGASSTMKLVAKDQFDEDMASTYEATWSVDGTGEVGTIHPYTGVYTAPSTPGEYTVRASFGGITKTKTVIVTEKTNGSGTLINNPPFLAVVDGRVHSQNAVLLFSRVEDDGPKDGLVYSWTATNAPAGAVVTFSANGSNAASEAIATFSKAGDYEFSLTVSDGEWTDTLGGYTVHVPLQLAGVAISAVGPRNADGSQQYQAAGKDQLGNNWEGEIEYTWSVVGHGTAITKEGLFTPPGTGPFTISVAAKSAISESPLPVSNSIGIVVPSGTTDGFSSLSISSPIESDVLKSRATVTGIATYSGSGAASYSLSVAPAALEHQAGAYVELGSGPTQAVEGPLGTFDPTLLPNGEYVIRLQLLVNGAAVGIVTRRVAVVGDQKVGSFTFSETDLSVPLYGGGAFSISRTYDSLNRFTAGPFGYGWGSSLDLDLREGPESRASYNFSLMDNLSTGSSGSQTMSVRTGGDRDVFVTLPSGRRVRFQFDIVSNGGDAYKKAVFKAQDSSVNATLQILNARGEVSSDINMGSSGLLSPYWEENKHNGMYDAAFNMLDAYDIPGYLLTEDGVQYFIQKTETAETFGAGGRLIKIDPNPNHYGAHVKHTFKNDPHLTKIIDPEGNTAYFMDVGNGNTLIRLVPASGGESGSRFVTLTRDSADRVTKIYKDVVATAPTDSAKLAVEYSYDMRGDLVSVNRKVSQGTSGDKWVKTEYGYADGGTNPVIAHAMTGIFMPHDANAARSGTPLLSNEYDAVTGRLKSTTDAAGNVARYDTTQVASRKQTVTDQRGVQTLYEYDDDGNVFKTTNLATGEKTFAVYQPGTHNMLAQTTAYGTPQAFTRYFTYDDHGAQTSETYTVGGHTLTTRATYVTIKGQHLLATSTDAYGTVTVNAYDSATGRLERTEVKDAAGNVLQKTTYDLYDANGNVRSVTQWTKDAVGWYRYAKTTNTFNTLGQLLETRVYGFLTRQDDQSTDVGVPESDADTAVLKLLQKTSMTYDAAGNVATTTQWLKNDAGQWVAYATSTNAYDLLNRVTKSIDPMGRTTETFYTDAGQVDYVVNALGNVTKYYYNELGQAKEVRTWASVGDYQSGSANHTATFTSYNKDGSVATTTDSFGGVTTSLYDAAGRVVQTLYPDGTSAETLYDAAGRTWYTTDRHTAGAVANATRTTYDAAGRAVLVERVSGVTIAVAAVTGLTAVHAAALTAAGAAFSSTRTHYDPYGRVAYTVDAAGGRTDYLYDVLGRQAAVIQPGVAVVNRATGTLETIRPRVDYEYDAVERQTASVAPWTWQQLGGTWQKVRLRTETQFNALGQAVATVYRQVVLNADGTDGTATFLSSTSATYDALGRRRSVTDEADRTTNYTYNVAGSLTDIYLPAVTNPATGQPARPHFQYGYNALGQQQSQTDPNGQVTTFTYDAFGREKSRTLPAVEGNTLSEHTTYDKHGRTLSQTSFEGHVTTYEYDDTPAAGGRLKATYLFANGSASFAEKVSYSYNPLGQVEQVTRVKGATTESWTYGYDADGRQTRVTSAQGTVNHVYDPATGRHTATWTGTNVNQPVTRTAYTYDALGRLETVSLNTRNGAAITPEVTTYRYDAAGNLTDVLQSNGVLSDYTYDALYRLTTLIHFVDADGDYALDVGESLKAKFAYTWNSDNTKATETNTDDLGRQATYTWGYDALRRLTSEALDSYDDAVDYADTYTFDLHGNRLTKVHDGAGAAQDGTTTYTNDARDRLKTEQADLTGTSNDTYTVYSYGDTGTWTMQTGKAVHQGLEATGTVISHTQMAYDLRGRMVSLTDGASTTTYTYDVGGSRTSQTVTQGSTTTTTTYLVDQNNATGYSQVLEEQSTDGTTTSKKTYTLGMDVVAQHDAADGTLVLLYDGHGSTRALLDTINVVVQRYAYDAYGNPLPGVGLTAAASALTRLLYSGEQTDRTGMQYLRARYYDSSSGRFGSFDSFRAGPTNPFYSHKFSFGNNNPISFNDPTGLFSLPEIIAGTTIGAAIGTTIGAVTGAAYGALKYRTFQGAFAGFAAGAFAGALMGAGAGLLTMLVAQGLLATAAGFSAAQALSSAGALVSIPSSVKAWHNLAMAINEGDSVDIAFGVVGVGAAWGGRFVPLFAGNRVTLAKNITLNQGGNPKAEFDGVRLAMLVEEKSGMGLQFGRTPQQRDPNSWAIKQIYGKTATKIQALMNPQISGSAPGSKATGAVLPSAEWIQAVKHIRFQVDSDDPAIIAAVEAQIGRLQQHFGPAGYTFDASYGVK